MNRLPISSSDLRLVVYDSSPNTLEIEFNSGGIYRYRGVPLATYKKLMSASSHGKYFHAHIKNVYPYSKDLMTAKDVRSIKVALITFEI